MCIPYRYVNILFTLKGDETCRLCNFGVGMGWNRFSVKLANCSTEATWIRTAIWRNDVIMEVEMVKQLDRRDFGLKTQQFVLLFIGIRVYKGLLQDCNITNSSWVSWLQAVHKYKRRTVAGLKHIGKHFKRWKIKSFASIFIL